MMQGIELAFDDRPNEWIDPVIDTWEEGGDLVIHNGAYEYRYPLAHITDQFEYDTAREETDNAND
jgi:hypothetical protein